MNTHGNPARTAATGPKVPPPAGSYSPAIKSNGFVFLAGQTPRLPGGERLNDEPFAVQARQTFENLERAAEAAGTSLKNATMVTVFLTDPANRFELDEIWRKYVQEPYPARTVVQSDLPGFAIEVNAIVAC